MTKDQGPLRNTRLIRGLHYFEAVARHQSVKQAAAELGVSQSAVSHQLRDLTEELGEQLIERSGRGIALPATGQRLAARLAATFAGLQSSLDDVIGKMAKAGLGRALVPDFLARRDIEAGSLRLVDRTRLPAGRRYHLCFKKSRADEPEIRAFLKWLKAACAPRAVPRLARGKSA